MSNKTNPIASLMIGLLSFLSILSFSACATGTSQSTSQYEASINIPKYNANDSTHVLITENNGNWDKNVLNDPTKQHFYIKPGTYHTMVRLTAHGTANKRRTLSLYNGNDKHPASLSVDEVADVRLWFMGGSYWTIDRLSTLNDTTFGSIRLYDDAAYNILNRLYIKDYSYAIIIYPFCHYNTVQNSYIDSMTHKGRMADNVAMALGNASVKGTRTIGTKFINNDIRNANDGIQLIVSSNTTDVQYPGTIIDSNRIWMDGDVYTNGDYATNGYNPNGEYMIGENAIDLKAGSNDPKEPVIITNNIMWGYQRGDKTAGGGFTAGAGTAFVVHKGVYNTKINNNILADSQRAFTVAGMADEIPYAAKDLEFKNNIIYKINVVNPLNEKTYACFIYNSRNIKIESNTFVDIPTNSNGSGDFFRFENTTNSTFSNNIIIDSYGTSRKEGNVVDDNYFYSSTQILNGTNNHTYTTAFAAKMEDYAFTYERFTAKPKQKTLIGVIATNKSPHYETAGSRVNNTTAAAASIYPNSRLFSEIIAFTIL